MTSLFVASTGGHLTQLHQLRPRLGAIGDDVTWVTFDTPQSRSLLEGEDVVFVDHTGSRDYRHVVTNGVQANRLLRSRHVSSVVSTGAAVALSFLPLARSRGIPCHYIESATRSRGPSRTGRLLSRVPGIWLYAQHAAWASAPWHFQGSVFDGYEVQPLRFARPTLRRVVVTLGAHEGFSFRRLVERLIRILPPEVDVLWQTGSTEVSDLPIEARAFVPARELATAIQEADAIVAHAGMGSVLCALEAGRCPVIVPRRAEHGEHIDDHQCDIAATLEPTGLAVVRSVENLELDDLVVAASRRVRLAESPRPFRLGDPTHEPETLHTVEPAVLAAKVA